MPNKFKKNKTHITAKHRKIFVKRFFEGSKAGELAKEFGYTNNAVEIFIKGRATKNYTDEKGNNWRRCSICGVYRIREKNYKKHSIIKGKIVLNAECNACYKVVNRNRKILEKNKKGKESKYLTWSRNFWNRNKWKYNTKRKIMRIIGYIDRTGKKIQKKDQK